jgi:predicted ATPase/transcriptional regulator with XRE-family HTH domain
MSSSDSEPLLQSFQTFGDLLRYLRRRARLTQRELSIAVGYSEAQISRLEQNQRPPDLTALMAVFIPALYVEDEPAIVARLMELAAQARGETLPSGGHITLSRSVRRELTETIQIVEDHIPGNLPLQLTSFIGREQEIAEIKRLLDWSNENQQTSRLITLIGSGGCGKTRLALEIAGQLAQTYQDGVWFIELASILDPTLVSQAVTSTLGLPESRDGAPIEPLIKYLRTKQILLIFDNCEQIVAETARLAEEILRACPNVQILATSREIFDIPGEIRFHVPPLSLPEGESLTRDIPSQSESVRLFVERTQAVFPFFALKEDNLSSVIRICRRLDGMPLAIELAAARMSALSVQQIAARLDNSFRLLTGGRTTLRHHQTLHATIAWSYDLLPEAERVLLGRLSVFSGGWTLEAAEAVVSDSASLPVEIVLDLLAQLVNKSLVGVEWQPGAEARYTMLQTIREFAHHKLQATAETEHMRARHFDYFFRMAQQGEENLFAAESSLDWAEREIDNLRATLVWALERDPGGASSHERTGRALELMLHVWPLWLSRGYSMEGNEWLNQLLSVHTASTPARARALLLMGDLAGFRRDYVGQTEFVQESLALARELGDRKLIAWSLMEMGLVERDRRYLEAIRFLTESLAMFQELDENLWVCRTSFLLAQTHTANGNLEAAKPLWQQGLALCREENDKWQIAWGLEGLGDVERLEEHLEQASELYSESLKLRVAVMDKAGIAYALEAFAQLAVAQQEFKRAAVLCAAAEQLLQTLNLLLDPSRQELHTLLIATARTQLGKETFAEAWDRGRTMKRQQAIEFALTPPGK